ncbi:unnamed protein product, partial [Effrenium voratum]
APCVPRVQPLPLCADRPWQSTRLGPRRALGAAQSASPRLVPGMLLLAAMVLNAQRLRRMLRPPPARRLVWSFWLWAPLSLVTVFDTSGNAVGYPVFFAFVLTYMRDRNGVIEGDWREALATFALVTAAVFGGIWLGGLPSHFLPVRRSWDLVVRLERLRLAE